VADRETLEKLSEAFASTFISELIPGMVHNFANPLNGIMGRAQIMERRLKEMIARMEKEHPAVFSEYVNVYEKLKRDVSAINQESDRFFSMFRDVSDKFSALQGETIERIDLARLLKLELRFADHYLDFKHGVTKEISLIEGLPEIQGPPRLFSLALWGLLRYIQRRMGRGKANRLRLEARREEPGIRLDFSYSVGDKALWDNETETLLNNVQEVLTPLGVKVEIHPAGGVESLFLLIQA